MTKVDHSFVQRETRASSSSRAATATTADYFATGMADFEITTSMGTRKVRYLGCYCDNSARAMTGQPQGPVSSSADKPMALIQAYEYCVAGDNTDGRKFTYFAVQYSLAAFCSNEVTAFTHACTNEQADGYGKRPDSECKHDLYHNTAINNGEGGGGGAWRNSIYMEVNEESCPDQYYPIAPTKAALYGDVPQQEVQPREDPDSVAAEWEDNHSPAAWSSDTNPPKRLGYEPYAKIDDVGSVLGCTQVCNEDAPRCAAIASDGMSKCFLYEGPASVVPNEFPHPAEEEPAVPSSSLLPMPYRTPGNFITCRKHTINDDPPFSSSTSTPAPGR